MATLSTDLWAIYLTLTETETQEIATTEDIGSAVGAIVAGVASAIPAGIAVAALSAILAGYLQLEKTLVEKVDAGNGVVLTLPWLAIASDQYLLIYPAPASTPQNAPVTEQLYHTIRNADGSWVNVFGLVEGQVRGGPAQFGTVACAGVGDALQLVGSPA